MKKFLSVLWVSSAILIASQAHAGEHDAVYSSFKDYEEAMRQQEQPLTLVVGCGHSSVSHDGYDHTHPNCWSVDLEDPDLYKPKGRARTYAETETEPFWKRIQANEKFDITAFQGTTYQNKFDVVVLEEPYETTLNKPRTLFNAASMLKVGGQLIVDHHSSYYYPVYTDQQSDTSLFILTEQALITAKNLPEQQEYNIFRNEWNRSLEIGDKKFQKRNIDYYAELGLMDINIENIKTKLKQFGIDEQRTIHPETKLSEMGDYLARWFFTDIVAVRDAFQPYTITPGEDIKTARKTSILSATKTQNTQRLMLQWKKVIQNWEKAHRRN